MLVRRPCSNCALLGFVEPAVEDGGLAGGENPLPVGLDLIDGVEHLQADHVLAVGPRGEPLAALVDVLAQPALGRLVAEGNDHLQADAMGREVAVGQHVEMNHRGSLPYR